MTLTFFMFSGGEERSWNLKISRCGRDCSCGCFLVMRACGGFIRADDSASRPAVGKKRWPGRERGRGGWCSASLSFPSLEHGRRKCICGEGKIFYSFFLNNYSFSKIAGRKTMSADVSGAPLCLLWNGARAFNRSSTSFSSQKQDPCMGFGFRHFCSEE